MITRSPQNTTSARSLIVKSEVVAKHSCLIGMLLIIASCSHMTSNSPKQSAEVSPERPALMGETTAARAAILPHMDELRCASNTDCGLVLRDGLCAKPPLGEPQLSVRQQAGPICYCDHRRCHRQEVLAVPCRRDNECGIENRNGFEIPIRLSVPRRRKLNPCAGDGSHIPGCSTAGFCTIFVYGC